MKFRTGILMFFSIAFASFKPTEKPNYLEIVQDYADFMIKHGRDRYGEVHSPLFASVLDREGLFVPHKVNEERVNTIGSWPEEKTVKLVDHTILYLNSPVSDINGVRNHDRSLFGSNPMRHQALYHILYQLTEITGDDSYAQEADNALEFFLKNTQSPETGLLAWGDHLHWNFHTDSWKGHDYRNVGDIHELSGEWEFWDESFRLAPESSHRFALGLWNHQVADQETGNFSRHTRYAEHGPEKNYDFPRYGGQMIATWADAWSRNQDTVYLKAIDVIISRFERKRNPKTGIIPAFIDATHRVWPGSNLEMARCLHNSALILPSPLADRLMKNAKMIDKSFLQFPHDPNNKGFVFTADTETREAIDGWNNNPGYTATWETGYGADMSAMMANLSYRRYQQIKEINLEYSDSYKQLILETAEHYYKNPPDTRKVLWPISFSNVIKLMLNAYEITKDEKWIHVANKYAKMSLNLFFDDLTPLPRASSNNIHYEAITGGPDLMYALLNLSKHHALSE